MLDWSCTFISSLLFYTKKKIRISSIFGTITITINIIILLKYIRVDFRTPVESVIEIMFESWRLYRPNIIISVTGGAKNFNVKANLRNALKVGIVKAALSTGKALACI